MKNKSTLVVIFLTIFIDLLGFGIIIPLLPSFSVNVLHINEFTIGLIAGIYSLMQFLFTPVWGYLSDRYGRKPILVMSLIGSVVSNLLLAFVFSGIILSASILILARAFAGIFAANISAAQAVISDVTSHEERTKGIGMISAAFALGFVFGPSIGGVLSQNFGYSFPVYISAALSLIAALLCIFIFKETLSKEIQLKNRLSKRKYNPFNLRIFLTALSNKSYGKYMIIFFVAVFSFSNIFGTFQLFAERKEGLNMNQAEIGYIFSFMGVMGALVQIFLLKIINKKIGEENTLILGSFIAIFGLGLIGFSTNLIFLLFVIVILSVGNGLNNTVSISMLSQSVGKEEQGTILGINQSLGSLARFLGPVWGGFVYQFLGYKYPFITGGLFMLIITLYSYYIIKKKK
ncbi:MAG: MFS transporter [Ignavibacteria bacterium]|nr:MFS transporter [Ignavibacteria bacterium]MBK9403288.1 MFS transporter [Ignavibacteria bacterium]